MLTVFALGILLIDLMIPPEWKWTNAVTAFMGVLFSAAGVLKIQYAQFEAAKVGRLMEFLTALGQDVEVSVRPSRKGHGEMSVMIG